MEKEVKAAVEALGQGVDAFKAEYDARIEETNQRLGKFMSAVQRNGLAGGEARFSADQIAHKQAFNQFVRKGTEEGLANLEAKSLNTGLGAEGGFAVPEEIDHTIESLLVQASPIRSIARVVEIGSSDWKTLVNLRGATSGWVAETGARTETTAPKFAEVVPPLGEIYANPAATQAMLDDGFFNVEEFLAENIASEFALQEGTAFVSGDGVNKPKGFLSGTPVTAGDGTRAFGTLQYLATGVSGAFPASNPADILFDLVDKLKAGYRQGAVFVMNSSTANAVRKLKDSSGQSLWAPSLAELNPNTLLGYPVVISEDMAAIGANSLSIAFGNFKRGYVITDRKGVRVLRDPFSNKPFVHFYTTKRVGGGIVNSEAIKLLKFSLS
ncbi:MAG: phage major capsid protein [Sphingomonadales bacterium]